EVLPLIQEPSSLTSQSSPNFSLTPNHLLTYTYHRQDAPPLPPRNPDRRLLLRRNPLPHRRSGILLPPSGPLLPGRRRPHAVLHVLPLQRLPPRNRLPPPRHLPPVPGTHGHR